ncbi:NAD(P)H-hydrate dehydratase [Permianibacter sp. IMCC34836]|uniref:NAD(P)H-hydrate dehydratase n=1 Tax=Permianibacter fluminis TaxID=2738515 RepID=UPI00155745AE|nr:NAD(P)H-hydrate dehydratase [Permianibacter fluminis]NQD38952.1 NAD(P)H-hydrate dehydratase [Permianibacter fluminis]
MSLLLPFPAGAPVLRPATVLELEATVAELDGIPTGTLMERAGAAAFVVLRQRWPQAKRLVVVCGRGNNAGDGYVLARLGHDAGLQVSVLQLLGERKDSGDAARALARLPVTPHAFEPGLLADADVIVDALFGIGLRGHPNAAASTVIAAINASHKPVLALDIPSGLDAETGAGASTAVHATVTTTFIARKPGLLTGRAIEAVGDLHCCALDLPASSLATAHAVAEHLALADLRTRLPHRRRASHKGDHGHVLVIGGAAGMGGAARLAGEAALRSGAGLVSVYCHRDYQSGLLAARPELMVTGFDGAPDGAALTPLVQRADVLVVGPGLSTAGWAGPLLEALIHTGKPLLLDADGLNALAHRPATSTPLPQLILTPHPGEAGRLLGISTAEVEVDRYAAANALQARYGGVIVLKGAGTIVTDGERTSVIAGGNPGMASGGMGDVLAGVIGALRGQGFSAYDAARLGVALHAWAGDQAVAKRGGERGLLASDLFEFFSAGLQPG